MPRSGDQLAVKVSKGWGGISFFQWSPDKKDWEYITSGFSPVFWISDALTAIQDRLDQENAAAGNSSEVSERPAESGATAP